MRGVVWRHQDSALALVVLAAGIVAGAASRHEVLSEWVVALLVAGAVAVRRRWPLVSLAAVQTLGVAVTALQLVAADTAGFVLAYLVLVYTVAAARPIRAALAGLGFSLVAFWSAHGLSAIAVQSGAAESALTLGSAAGQRTGA